MLTICCLCQTDSAGKVSQHKGKDQNIDDYVGDYYFQPFQLQLGVRVPKLIQWGYIGMNQQG
jgi:hypothetical protein